MLHLSVLSDSLQPHGLSLPGSSVHGIFQARIWEWVDLTNPGIEATSLVSLALAGWILYHCATWEALIIMAWLHARGEEDRGLMRL